MCDFRAREADSLSQPFRPTDSNESVFRQTLKLNQNMSCAGKSSTALARYFSLA
jgi:hypothetical protein